MWLSDTFLANETQAKVGWGVQGRMSILYEPPLPYRRRQWQPIPVLLPGKFCGRRSLVGCHPWGRTVGHDWSDLAAAAAIALYIKWGLTTAMSWGEDHTTDLEGYLGDHGDLSGARRWFPAAPNSRLFGEKKATFCLSHCCSGIFIFAAQCIPI